ncbi:hypothetical protein [Gordonia paraffinivorans]|uniref:hypothetical protein n=1 Tax=Gordonia paraffinivorans TaxID=175628 RepID=UPI001C630D3C|nr:hypothetical protein [Gordonia paraffinivorans]
MALSAAAAHHRARIAALSRDRSADDPELVDARRDLAATRLEEHVAKVLATAPPLTQEQRGRIASLLRVNPHRPQADHADLGITDRLADAIGGDA